ncbi:MAG TPA: phosphonate C-P lyase system protein PhnH [Aliidongia sp.]|nr:phosphonate C-P lyase system protein PhnH [Aliidongia sp.]
MKNALQPQAGFADPVDEAQLVFRQILDAMSHPGRIVTMARPADLPPGLGRAATATALTLLDFETPVWLDPAAMPAAAHLRFHCNCPIVPAPEQAAFAFVAEPLALPPLDRFPLGSDAYPDRSTMLVIEVAQLDDEGPLRLTGPGIQHAARLGIAGLPVDFWAARAALAPLFPRGLDLILTAGDRLAALPRTTLVSGG